MANVQVRYIVRDVDEALPFYTELLDFELVMHPAPTFAMLVRGELRLLLSAPSPAPGGGQALAGQKAPEPGGWNRIGLEVPDLGAAIARLRAAGAHFRGDPVTGVGVRQVLVEDPSGNAVELFEPIAREARLDP